MNEDDAWVEYLLNQMEIRVAGKPMTDAEALEAHLFAAEMAELREKEEERE